MSFELSQTKSSGRAFFRVLKIFNHGKTQEMWRIPYAYKNTNVTGKNFFFIQLNLSF